MVNWDDPDDPEARRRYAEAERIDRIYAELEEKEAAFTDKRRDDGACRASRYADEVAALEDPEPCKYGHLGCATTFGGECQDELATACGCDCCCGDAWEEYDELKRAALNRGRP